MADSEAIPDILNQVLDEYGGRIGFDGASKILVSDANIAKVIHKATEPYRTPYGPTVTLAARGEGSSGEASKVEGIATVQQFDSLQMDVYSHAVFGVASEDPKYILQGMKTMIFAMQPKGVAIVISLKQETGEAQDGNYTVGLEDKMMYQSKGKVGRLTDVMEYAGFEKGKIRSFERSSEAGGKKVEAEVVLAMKWDQLTG